MLLTVIWIFTVKIYDSFHIFFDIFIVYVYNFQLQYYLYHTFLLMPMRQEIWLYIFLYSYSSARNILLHCVPSMNE